LKWFGEFIKAYSGISDEKVLEHVYEVVSPASPFFYKGPKITRGIQRDKAWEIRSYPCTGLRQFLNPLIIRGLAYRDIVGQLKKGERRLEIRRFIGQDLRRLVSLPLRFCL
jgi:hypothetical protein